MSRIPKDEQPKAAPSAMPIPPVQPQVELEAAKVEDKLVEVKAEVKKTEKSVSQNLKQKSSLDAKASKATPLKTSEKQGLRAPQKEKSKSLLSEKNKTVVKIEETIEVTEVKSPKDQGDMLIAKAKEEMLAIHQARAEKTIKAKPIKIEKGNIQDEKAKWIELNKRHSKDKALPYKMTDKYDSLQPLQHKVLGWGFILSNENDRLEVLFENGIKMLISNYKPS